MYIYFADDPILQEWKPHPKNPVLSDTRVGRNAGKIKRIHDKLYRYGQFSGDTYGKAITKSEILIITETEYREKFIEIVSLILKKVFITCLLLINLMGWLLAMPLGE